MRLPRMIMQICIYSFAASSSASSPAASPTTRLQFMQHVLQLRELAPAITPGDGGVDRFRGGATASISFNPFSEIDTTPRRRSLSRSCARSGGALRGRAGCAIGWGRAGKRVRELGDLDRVDGSQRAQDAPLLLGQSMTAQRGTELPHHGLARAQQRHRQRAREFAHRHATTAASRDLSAPDRLRKIGSADRTAISRELAPQQTPMGFARKI